MSKGRKKDGLWRSRATSSRQRGEQACRIFNGTISTRERDWSYLDNYTIEGLPGKYINLNPQYNTEANEVRLVAIEGRNNNVPIFVKHKPSEELK